VAGFFAAWQAVFLLVPFNPLFISKPDLIWQSFVSLLTGGDLLRDLAISAVPFVYGFITAGGGRHPGIVSGWRTRVGYALDPLMTMFYASRWCASRAAGNCVLGVVAGKAIIIFLLSVFRSSSIASRRTRGRSAVHQRGALARRIGARLYLKVIVPRPASLSSGACIAVGRGLIGILVGEFFAASEGIGYAIARFGDLFALDKMFACILSIMVIAVVMTEGIRWAERTAFPWRVGQ
jgi:NitT/TauT family transport system permease protein